MAEGSNKKDKLWNLCQKFISDNQIGCPETVYQTDWVSLNSLEFIEKVCKIVGYYEDPEASPGKGEEKDSPEK